MLHLLWCMFSECVSILDLLVTSVTYTLHRLQKLSLCGPQKKVSGCAY